MPNETNESNEDRQQSRWTWIIPLTVLAVLGVLYFVRPDFRAFIDDAYRVLSSGESERIRGWVGGFGA
jgi:hypothetical protein